MTTVLATRDYILADRLVDYGGQVKETPKLHKYKNKFVLYTGERVIDQSIYKKLMFKLVNEWLDPSTKKKAEENLRLLLEEDRYYDQMLIFTATHTYWFLLSESKMESRVVNPNSVWTTGSGGTFALCAEATGIAPKNIIPLVGSIDPATSSSYDLFYRKHLR